MKNNVGYLVGSGLFVGMALSAQVTYAGVASVDVAPGTPSTYTVPAKTIYFLRHITVSNPGASSECNQEVIKIPVVVVTGTSAVTTADQIKTKLCIPAGSSFEENFSPPIEFTAGQTLEFSNGSVDDVTTTFTFDLSAYVVGEPILLNDQ